MPEAPRVRLNGFQGPLSREQVFVALAYFVLTLIGFVVMGLFLEGPRLIGSIVPFGVLALITTSCWVYIESTDPAVDGIGKIACPCMRVTQEAPPQYCPVCRKHTMGLDHHCVWLNTDIGTRNYFQFYLMSVTGTLQFGWHTIVSVLIMTAWLPDASWVNLPALYVLVSMQALGAFGVAIAVGSLWGFHSYLLVLGRGTYDWVIWRWEERDRKRREAAEKRRAERQAQAEEQRRAANPNAAGVQQDHDSFTDEDDDDLSDSSHTEEDGVIDSIRNDNEQGIEMTTQQNGATAPKDSTSSHEEEDDEENPQKENWDETGLEAPAGYYVGGSSGEEEEEDKQDDFEGEGDEEEEQEDENKDDVEGEDGVKEEDDVKEGDDVKGEDENENNNNKEEQDQSDEMEEQVVPADASPSPASPENENNETDEKDVEVVPKTE